MSDGFSVIRDSLAISIEKWLTFLTDNHQACYYHTPYYYNALINATGVSPAYFCILKNEKIAALAIGETSNEIRWLPGITRRTIFYAEPLFKDADALEELFLKINSENNGLFVQFRPFMPLTERILSIFTSNGYKFSNHLNAYIPITKKDEILESFEKDKKKAIKSASQKYGIRIGEYDDINEAVNKFYQIQRQLYREKRHAIKGKEYFRNLILTSEGHVRIIFVLINDEPIACQLYIIYGSRLSALYTSTLKEHRNKKAGDLLVWHMINIALESDIKYFDFGGGGNPEKPYAPREYKKRFGTKFENVGRLTLSKSFLYRYIIYLYHLILKN